MHLNMHESHHICVIEVSSYILPFHSTFLKLGYGKMCGTRKQIWNEFWNLSFLLFVFKFFFKDFAFYLLNIVVFHTSLKVTNSFLFLLCCSKWESWLQRHHTHELKIWFLSPPSLFIQSLLHHLIFYLVVLSTMISTIILGRVKIAFFSIFLISTYITGSVTAFSINIFLLYLTPLTETSFFWHHFLFPFKTFCITLYFYPPCVNNEFQQHTKMHHRNILLSIAIINKNHRLCKILFCNCLVETFNNIIFCHNAFLMKPFFISWYFYTLNFQQWMIS